MKWISVQDLLPGNDEPVVYARKKPGSHVWFVGIAYWTKSDKWKPEAESTFCPDGFTHWCHLPEPPND